ncbi:unnamed protein product [Candidula unifasciata]|uniref:Uncharacterized protein n=1 Tax=Candidula unifasciata TaxID=100452 RepID=A0A8S3YUS8_9EUPU|nr:unnamed protein product [Candidula unifasciata]
MIPVAVISTDQGDKELLAHGHSHADGHSHGHSFHSHDMAVGMCILSGIIVFLVADKCGQFLRYRCCRETDHENVSSDSHLSSTSNSSPGNKSSTKKPGHSFNDKNNSTKRVDNNSLEKTNRRKIIDISAGFIPDIKVTGYLTLAADFAYNFTDGLAIGASFMAGGNIGTVTSLTIFVHELSHEIGDFAILVQSGYSKGKAVLLQFLTALGSLLGTVYSLTLHETTRSATSWILPFTAGGFIYIALVSVIPELLEKSRTWQSIKEILAMIVGVFLMVLVALYE